MKTMYSAVLLYSMLTVTTRVAWSDEKDVRPPIGEQHRTYVVARTPPAC